MERPSAKNPPRGHDTDATAQKQRDLQREQDRQDAQAKGGGEPAGKAVQTGLRGQPEPPLPAQHLAKPGIEAQMQLKPKYQAPDYRGSDKLKDMVALVTGGDSGAPWPCCMRARAPTWRSCTSRPMRTRRRPSARWSRRGASAC
jgi:hypothetical protein